LPRLMLAGALTLTGRSPSSELAADAGLSLTGASASSLSPLASLGSTGTPKPPTVGALVAGVASGETQFHAAQTSASSTMAAARYASGLTGSAPAFAAALLWMILLASGFSCTGSG